MKKHRRFFRLRMQSVTSVISTTMVLVLLGMVTLSVLTAKEVAHHVRQNLTLTVMLGDEVLPPEAAQLQEELLQRPYVADIEYISSEQALLELTEGMELDGTEFLEVNPLSITLELRMAADYAQNDSLEWVAQELGQLPQVSQVAYPRDLVDNLNHNIRRISVVLLVIAVLLVLVSVTLIVNMVRLSIYTHRYEIRTMKLVGARWGFIRRPFLLRSATIGLLSTLLAMAVLWGFVRGIASYEADVLQFITARSMLLTALGMAACSLVITVLSTYVCVTHYLRKQTSI